MPETINGIGTWYYGKSNVKTRQGWCEHCKRETTLSSHDTRKWFVIFFIPIIPLGRKRVLDECPHCTRHRALDLAEWHKLREEVIRKGLEEMAAHPKDPEAAIRLHQSYLYFDQTEESARVLDFLRQGFPADVKTQLYLGGVLNSLRRPAEATDCFERALALQPDNREAQLAAGVQRLVFGRLAEAHALLKFLEEEKADPRPSVLLALAAAYQKEGKHDEALRLFGLAARQGPALNQDREFRRSVQQSEQALGRTASTLPPLKRRIWPYALGSGLAAAALLVALFVNYHISQNRTLHVVNGSPQPVTLTLDGQPAIAVASGGLQTLTLAEGTHHVSLTGGVAQEMDFTLETGFWERFASSPLFILNAGGRAILVEETAIYSAAPSGPGRFALHYGQPFLSFPDVDYAFKPFPEQIRLESKQRSVAKTRVGWLEGKPVGAFYGLLQGNRASEALGFMEWYLDLHPADSECLSAYSGAALQSNSRNRASAFLAAGCGRRPVEIEWHRTYQTLRQDEPEALRKEYDGGLAAAPEDARLLYLRGRLCSSCREARAFYERALAKDPRLAHAHHGLAYQLAGQGEWRAAREHAAAACEAEPANRGFRAGLFRARCALGEWEALEKELRAAVILPDPPALAYGELAEVLAVQRKTKEFEDLCAQYERKISGAVSPERARGAVAGLRSHFFYILGDFPAMEIAMAQQDSESSAAGRFQIAVEQLQPKQAEVLLKGSEWASADHRAQLALSLAAQHAGDAQQAAAWRKSAADLLAKGDEDERRTAALLTASQCSLDQLTDLNVDAAEKALVAAVLAQRFPNQSEAFLGLSRRLNVSRAFPYHLLRKITEKTP
jgi:tetratricopeptide (TPR) repeat protein